MRPIKVTVSAAGDSPWIPINYLQVAFGIGLSVVPWSTATGLTYVVQHSFDSLDPLSARPISIARAGTVATVTDLGDAGQGHGLSTGDNIIIKGSGSTYLDTPYAANGKGDLGADITVTGNTTYTYAVTNAGPTADNGSAKALSMRVFSHATLNSTSGNPGATGLRADGNYAFPPQAIRLRALTLTGGAVDLLVVQGMGH
ncbi:unnamed protein product [Sphagnum balticum]